MLLYRRQCFFFFFNFYSLIGLRDDDGPFATAAALSCPSRRRLSTFSCASARSVRPSVHPSVRSADVVNCGVTPTTKISTWRNVVICDDNPLPVYTVFIIKQ